MEAVWRIELLGGLRAVRGGTGAQRGARVVTRFRSQQTALLLAYLAYYSHRSHPREQLCELLWPEGDPGTARANLRNVLRWLRDELEPGDAPGAGACCRRAPAGAPSEGSAVLLADRASIRFDPAAITTDVAEFEAALQLARSSEGGSAQTPFLSQAVEVYQGELLPGYHEDWILQERSWLAERYFAALAELLAHLEHAGDFERAVAYARRGVSADPLREEAHRDLIRLYAAVGQPEAALRQYHELGRLLKEQLDLRPDAVTRALAREIERRTMLRPVPAVPRIAGLRNASPGAEKPPSGAGENRLVTLLCVEISAPIEAAAHRPRDLRPVPINRLLQAIVEIVLKYEGRMDRFQEGTAGERWSRVAAVFGVPRGHEEDPERAIRAALEIREAARHGRWAVRAGIHTGEVPVGPGSAPRGLEMGLAGPATALASALQERAATGQILVSEVTQRLTRRAFGFSPLARGIPGPTGLGPVYVVEQALPRPEKPYGIEGLRAPLIGRDEELAKLRAALGALPQAQGQIVCLMGEAGIGKSRLVAELRQGVGGRVWGVGEAAPDPASYTLPPTPLWLEGRCLELTMTAGYSLFVDLFRDYFAWPPEEGERARGERLAAALRELVERGKLSEERFEEMGPLLGNLLSLRFGTDWDQRLRNAGPEQIRHQTLLAVRDLLVALAHGQPAVLVLEDLHWADSLSLDLISLLMEALPEAPLLLLCVYRPEREHQCWHLAPIASRKCPERCTEIALRELTPPQSRRLVEALLPGAPPTSGGYPAGGESLPAAVKELILEKARGNPFFVEEVIRSLIASGLVYREGAGTRGEGGTRAQRGSGGWRAKAGVESVSVPESVQSLILSRVDRLEPELRGVLESAAVIGRLFRRRLLEAVVGSGHEAQPGAAVGSDRQSQRALLSELPTIHYPLATALWELEEQALIYQERVVPEEEYSFQHMLTQETIYQSILRPRRAAFHRQVAEAMEALYQDGLEEYYEQLAYHYERSGVAEKAVEYLLKAGEKGRRAYLNEEALGYFQRALERLDAPGLWAGSAEGGAPGTHEVGGRSVGRVPPEGRVVGPGPGRKEWRLDALKGLGQIHLGTGHVPEAEEYFRQAVSAAKEIGLAPREMARLYWWLGEVLWWRGKYEEMYRLGEEGLALLGEDTESVEAALINVTVAVGYGYVGNSEKWREFMSRNVRFIDRLPYSEELRPAHFHIVRMYGLDRKQIEEATRWLQIFQRKADEHHDLRALAQVHQMTAVLFRARGDLRGSIPQDEQMLELCLKTGDEKHLASAAGELAGAYLALGEIRRAEEYASRALAVAEGLGSEGARVFAYGTLGTVSLVQGASERAIAAFQRVIDLWRNAGNREGQARAIYALGRAYLAQGDRQKALKQFQEALTWVAPDTATGAGSLLYVTNYTFAAILSGLEDALEDPEEFRALCRRYREERPEAASSHFVQWYLEPAQPDSVLRIPYFVSGKGGPDFDFAEYAIRDTQYAPLDSGWIWHDPFGDCSFAVQNGLEIHAATGRDLRHFNASAPRLLRPASADFAIQTVCLPASDEKPAIGGLLLWKDQEHFLRLERGAKGKHEITFDGCVANEHYQFGRGRLVADRVFLRLERRGPRVDAFCSADGQEWFTAGHVDFPVEDPVEAGLHALGAIDRLIYPGAYPDGTAIRFECFELLGPFQSRTGRDRTGGEGAKMSPASSLLDELILLRECLATVTDPRHARGIRHPVLAVLSLAVLALMAGQSSLSAIWRWGAFHPELLAALGLRCSPSVATLSRLLRAVSVLQVREALLTFTRHFTPQRRAAVAAAGRPLPDPGKVSADGKTRGAAGEAGRPQQVLHRFAAHSRAALDQVPVHDRGDEVSATRAWIEQVAEQFPGLTVLTGDALLADRTLCQAIVESGRDQAVLPAPSGL